MQNRRQPIRFSILPLGLIACFVLFGVLIPTPASATSTIADVDVGTGFPGAFMSVRMNSAGFPVISYYVQGSADLRLAVCDDAQCTNPTYTTIDSAGDVGWYSTLALNASGYPVISYWDQTRRAIKLAVCQNIVCTAKTITNVVLLNSINAFPSMTLTSSGIPVIAFSESTVNIQKLAVCADSVCSSNTVTDIEAVGAASFNAITLGSNGFPIIVYSRQSEGLKAAFCSNATCTTRTLTVIDTVGGGSAIRLNSSGFPVISYFSNDGVDNMVKVAVCSNATCTSKTINTAETFSGQAIHTTSLALTSTGIPVIGYWISNANTNAREVKVAACADVTCTSATPTIVYSDNSVVASIAMILNSSNNPIVLYTRDFRALSAAFCSNATCTAKALRDIDAVHNVGAYSSLALTSSGNPVIGYLANDTVNAAFCADVVCASKTLVPVKNPPMVSFLRNLAMALRSDNIPVFTGDGGLGLVTCTDAACSGSTTSNEIGIGEYGAMVLNSSNLPVIADADIFGNPRNVFVTVCADATCTSKTTNIIDTNIQVNSKVSLRLNSSGFPVVAYTSGSGLKVAVCGDAVCNTKTVAVVDAVSSSNPSLALTSSGFPVIAFSDFTNTWLKVRACADATCTGSTWGVAELYNAGNYISLVLNSSNFPVVSFYNTTDQVFKVAACRDAVCNNKNVVVADGSPKAGQYTSAKLRNDGRLFVSYYDGTNADLKMYTDDAIAIPPTPTPTYTPTNTPVPPRTDTIGVYKDGNWALRNSNSAGSPDITTVFGGDPSDLPVTGDWNGDGRDTIGIYRSSTAIFYLSDTNTAPTITYSFVFGNPGDTPFAGKWASDMTHDGVGVYRNSNGILFQKKELISGFGDYFAVFGDPGDQGIAGDWENNGYDSIGIYRSGNQTWYLTNNSTPSGVTFGDISFVWDIGSAAPVIGDWDGTNGSTVGYLTSAGTFTLHSTNATVGTDNVFAFGAAGSRPVAGKWTLPSQPPVLGVIAHPRPGTNSNRLEGAGD
jgi:hypothetical protein